MARKTSEPSNGAEWIASWSAANVSIASTTAGTAPVELPQLTGVPFVNMVFSGIAPAKTFTWHLVLVDLTRVLDNDGNPACVRSIEFTTTATTRRTDYDGGGGEYFHDDVILDIDGNGACSSGHEHRWYLVLANIDGDEGAQLRCVEPTKAPGSR